MVEGSEEIVRGVIDEGDELRVGGLEGVEAGEPVQVVMICTDRRVDEADEEVNFVREWQLVLLMSFVGERVLGADDL